MNTAELDISAVPSPTSEFFSVRAHAALGFRPLLASLGETYMTSNVRFDKENTLTL